MTRFEFRRLLLWATFLFVVAVEIPAAQATPVHLLCADGFPAAADSGAKDELVIDPQAGVAVFPAAANIFFAGYVDANARKKISVSEDNIQWRLTLHAADPFDPVQQGYHFKLDRHTGELQLINISREISKRSWTCKKTPLIL